MRQREQKERLNAAYYVVEELAARISIMLGNKENQIGHIWDYFPTLYQEEKKAADQARKESEMERIRESRHNFAAVHNRQYKEVNKGGGECTDITDIAGCDTGEHGTI